MMEQLFSITVSQDEANGTSEATIVCPHCKQPVTVLIYEHFRAAVQQVIVKFMNGHGPKDTMKSCVR